jgi:hypothetical protein
MKLSKYYIIIIITITLANVIYNIFHQSFDSIYKYAIYEYKNFAKDASIDTRGYRGPYVRQSLDEEYIFRWEKINLRDTFFIEVKMNDDNFKEAEVHGYNGLPDTGTILKTPNLSIP